MKMYVPRREIKSNAVLINGIVLWSTGPNRNMTVAEVSVVHKSESAQFSYCCALMSYEVRPHKVFG